MTRILYGDKLYFTTEKNDIDTSKLNADSVKEDINVKELTKDLSNFQIDDDGEKENQDIYRPENHIKKTTGAKQ